MAVICNFQRVRAFLLQIHQINDNTWLPTLALHRKTNDQDGGSGTIICKRSRLQHMAEKQTLHHHQATLLVAPKTLAA
jgi:hypothetical protein